jgi:transposase
LRKASLQVAARPGGKRWTLADGEAGIGALVRCLQDLKPTLVVLEATGGLEMALVAAVAAAELPVVVVNPRQARDFAKALGKLAKTDGIDAQVVAHFGEALRPEVRPLKEAQAQELAALLTRRRQLLEMLTAEKNRLGSAPQRVRQRHPSPYQLA